MLEFGPPWALVRRNTAGNRPLSHCPIRRISNQSLPKHLQPVQTKKSGWF